MKIAIVYNRDSKNVINLFGIPNREKIGLKTIKRIADGLKKGKHTVEAFEGDKDLIDKLEEFMPRVLAGERPGMVFNISYGIQGRARYTHVPGMLEMAGIPYVGSGPLAHSLALDKVVAKMIFRQQDIPTPDFAVLDAPGFDLPDLPFPMIVKPKNEALSFGLRIVNNEQELREGADFIFEQFQQPTLVEQYIDGREINVGIIGNNPPETLPVAELIFGEGGPPIYTIDDKRRRSDREIDYLCPAPITEKQAEAARDIALRAFRALGCNDCARVDMRLDKKGRLYVLELNSLPSLGEHGSYTIAAAKIGLDFTALVNRLVDVAAARYFGTHRPPAIANATRDPKSRAFSYLVQHRDQIERRVREWVNLSSRTDDPAGLQEAVKKLRDSLEEIGLKPVKDLADERSAWLWETRAGLEQGTLIVGHLDIPIDSPVPTQHFRRDPEWLFGEGIGVSRGPLVMLEFALRSLRSLRRLRHIPLGVLYYTDEGRDCRYSGGVIRKAASRARQVLVMRPGNMPHHIITQRRGWRKYRLIVSGKPSRLGKTAKLPELLSWIGARLDSMSKLSSRSQRLAVAATELKTEAYPQLLPHRVTATILVSYFDSGQAENVEQKIKDILGSRQHAWDMELISDRPPLKKRKVNERLIRSLSELASEWDIPLDAESSLLPSVAGLISGSTAAACGLGPVVRDIDTPQESIQRISLLQRTLLLSQFLLHLQEK